MQVYRRITGSQVYRMSTDLQVFRRSSGALGTRVVQGEYQCTGVIQL